MHRNSFSSFRISSCRLQGWATWISLLLAAGCSHKDTPQLPLSISGFVPAAGPAHTLVTIQGTGFNPNTSKDIVSFNGVKANVVEVNDTALIAEAPDNGSTGDLDVSVGNWQLKAGTYTYQALSIHGASPLNGPAGTNIRISGTGFGSKDIPATVTIGGVPASITSASDTLLIAAVPAAASTGAIQVTVNATTALGPVFLVQKITSIRPVNGGAGTIDTVRGSGFGKNNGAITLAFNGKPAILSSINDSVLIAAVPAGVTTGPVTVSMNGQKTVGPVFSVVPVPTITTISPQSGPAGTSVTISGSNFSTIAGATKVDFNGVPAAITSVSASKVIVTAPAGAKTGRVHIVTNGQATQGPVYTYQLLNVTNISPDNGLEGTTVTITGNNFSTTPGATQVFFNDKAATVVSVSPTALTATVPAGVTTGQVSIQVNGVPALGPVFRRAGVFTIYNNPSVGYNGIAVDPGGNIYVTSSSRNNITKIAPDGSSSIFAGSLTGEVGSAQGHGTDARFNGPSGIVSDASGNLYVGDNQNGVIRKISPAGDVTTYMANLPPSDNMMLTIGAGGKLYLGNDNGLRLGAGIFDISHGTLAQVNSANISPQAYAVDPAGNLFYAVHPESNASITTLSEQQAGGVLIPTFVGGFNNVGTLAVDPTTGNILVGEASNGGLYTVTPDGINRTTLVAAGQGVAIDGNLNQASFVRIAALTVTSDGTIYLLDNQNTIRKVTLK